MKNISSPVYYAQITDEILRCNCTTNAIEIVLPPLNQGKGKITVIKSDTSTNAVTITPYRKESWDESTAQVETATVIGTVTGAGNATVVITSARLGFAKTISVPVEVDDTASVVGEKIRIALVADSDIGHPLTGLFAVSGSGASVVLTAVDRAGNDSTLNISIDNGTCTGLTTAGTSTNTTAGTTLQLTSYRQAYEFGNDGAMWFLSSSNSTFTNPKTTYSIGTHSYGSAHADWTLSASELLNTVHKPTAADQAVNAIIPATAGIPYVFINGTGQALTVKTAGGTGVTITNGKTAIVMADGTNVIALAAQSA